MARLYRPHIPIAVRVIVAERQCFEMSGKLGYLRAPGKNTAGAKLSILLPWLAQLFGCPVDNLRLDHDPPLAARPKERRGLSPKTFYTPDANDPDHLFYRPHDPEHEGSHLIKTNVRGDHGQHPDRVLIKKQKRLERGPRPKRSRKIQSPGFKPGKTKWPSRPFNRRGK